MSRHASAAISPDDLTVLRMLSQGATVEVIARDLNVSVRTLRRRNRQLCDQLEVRTPIEAVVWAVRHQLI